MTASITRSCKSVLERLRSGSLLAFLLLLPMFVFASESRVRYADIVARDDGYVVNADFELDLNPRLIDAINRGVSLHFTAEFQVERPRWYWFNDTIVERSLDYRLSYHTITRSYRLSVGNLHQSFDTLDAALQTMLRIRNWHVVGLDTLESGVSYHAAVRMRHDTSMLPRPFQVTAIGSREWNVATDWLRWTFLAGTTR